MSGTIPVGRLATLIGRVPAPAFSGLATRLASLIADGLLPLGQRCPANAIWRRRSGSPGRR
ncbi:MAG: hypothetical protein QM619_17040 [Micropruina sp.]|uniref:hypothetical protein n=1 Tax=Micropruina sp. TaxID=2737536 RepID=UPI0039E26419